MNKQNCETEKKYYYVNGSMKKLGPVTRTDLETMMAERKINAQTRVWCEGLTTWVLAPQVIKEGDAMVIPQKPESYMLQSILLVFLCCMPAGAVALYYACKVDDLYLNGYHQQALEASQMARRYNLLGFWIVIALIGFSLLCAMLIVIVEACL